MQIEVLYRPSYSLAVIKFIPNLPFKRQAD
jgi:hypothetical protein